jgi:hypothetical protein
MIPYKIFFSKSRNIKALHSLRPRKENAIDNNILNLGLQGHKLGIDMNTNVLEINSSGSNKKN